MKTLILLFLFSCGIYAQGGLSLSVQQDVKLATVGDRDRGYDAFTTDVLIRFKMRDNGHFSTWGEFEYADIEGDYYRYSVNVGYSFFRDFEVTPYVGFGSIDRYGKNLFSFGGGLEMGVKLNESLKIVSTVQLTDRKDLLWLWGDKKVGVSWFLGIEYNFKLKESTYEGERDKI